MRFKSSRNMPSQSNGSVVLSQVRCTDVKVWLTKCDSPGFSKSKCDKLSTDSDTVSQRINSPSDQEDCESIGDSDVSWSVTVGSNDDGTSKNCDSAGTDVSSDSGSESSSIHKTTTKTQKSPGTRSPRSKVRKPQGMKDLESIAKLCRIRLNSKKYRVIFGSHKAPQYWIRCIYHLLLSAKMKGPSRKRTRKDDLKKEARSLA